MGLLLAYYWRTILILVALLSIADGADQTYSIVLPFAELPEASDTIQNVIDLASGEHPDGDFPPVPPLDNKTAIERWLILILPDAPPSPRSAEFRARMDRILHNDTA